MYLIVGISDVIQLCQVKDERVRRLSPKSCQVWDFTMLFATIESKPVPKMITGE